MEYEFIQVTTDEATATILLNRPEKMNALSAGLHEEVTRAIDGLERDSGVKVVVFAGAGRAFAAGADISEFAARSSSEQEEVTSKPRIYDAVASCTKPTVAAVHGYCLGGGCELALACDLRIADRSARFGQPEVRLGLIPGGGGTQRLPRLVGRGQAARMILTGEFIGAEEAYRIGLVDYLVQEGQHLQKATEVSGLISRWSSSTLALAKGALAAAAETPLSDGLRIETDLFLEAFASEDGRKGVRAFVERGMEESAAG